jgi:uncharacterized protein
VKEEAVEIQTRDDVTLEGRLAPGAAGPASAGALLCHPHPLYGGTMGNAVVLAARDALVGLGVATLRFNFRGVGRSGGAFDDGRGERLDLEAAFERLAATAGGGCHLVAYSFGAWVAVEALDAGLSPTSAVLVSPPVELMDFSRLSLPPTPILVVSGDRDQFCPPAALDRWLARQPPVDRVVLSGVDHFYVSGELALQASIAGFVGPRLSREAP